MNQKDEAIRREVAEIGLKIEELKKRRKELLSELGEGRLSWGAIIMGGFGAFMIGLGIIALFAANWDVFGRGARAAIALAPVIACGVVAVIAHAKGVKSHALWEPLGILWCVSVAAAACLVAQTYQVGGSVPGLVLFVALLMLPVVWCTRAVAPMALWPIMAIVWTMIFVDAHGSSSCSIALAAKGTLLMALSLPAYIAFLRSCPPKAAFVSAQVVTGLVYSFGLGLLICVALPVSYWNSNFATIMVMVYWACSALVAGFGKAFSLPAWGMVGAVAFPTPFFDDVGAYVSALVIIGGIVAYGISKLRLGFANVGGLTFLWLVLAKFFASSASFALKGVVLIVAGVAFTALNLTLLKIRKARRA